MPVRERLKRSPIDDSRQLLTEYRPKIKIDEHSLEQELIRHPDLGRDINDEYKLAISYRDEAKHKLEIEEAEFDKDYRSHTPKGERVTDKEIRATASLDDQIKALVTEIREWSLVVGYWENLSLAARDRGYMLTKLVELYMSDYFGDVSGRGERAAVRDRLAAEARTHEQVRRSA